MIKKIISALICVLIVLSLVPFTASAAESAVYKLRVVDQTDKKITVSFDLDSGTGFSAIDFEINYNKNKLTYDKNGYGKGFSSFKSNNDGVFSIVNPEGKSIRGSIASLTPFEKQGNDGSVLVVTFSKIPGTRISEGDITVTIDNCQFTDSSYNSKPVSTTVSYDFGASVQIKPTENKSNNEGGTVEYEQGTSIKNGNDSEIGEPVNEQPSNSNAGELQQGSVGTVNGNNSESKTNAEASSAKEKNTSNKTKSMVIIAVAVLAVAGIGAVVLIFIKNKKKPENQF